MSKHNNIHGDPWRESRILEALQDKTFTLPGVQNMARGLSHFGEHALGWMGIGAVGVVANRGRRQRQAPWVRVIAAAFVSHAASVVLKRIVRRPRPHAPGIRIGVKTPSKLSFPSSHATSTTAAAIAISQAVGHTSPLAIIPVMMLSRMVLGVHYPTDVLAGSALGASTAVALQQAQKRCSRGK